MNDVKGLRLFQVPEFQRQKLEQMRLTIDSVETLHPLLLVGQLVVFPDLDLRRSFSSSPFIGVAREPINRKRDDRLWSKGSKIVEVNSVIRKTLNGMHSEECDKDSFLISLLCFPSPVLTRLYITSPVADNSVTADMALQVENFSENQTGGT